MRIATANACGDALAWGARTGDAEAGAIDIVAAAPDCEAWVTAPQATPAEATARPIATAAARRRPVDRKRRGRSFASRNWRSHCA